MRRNDTMSWVIIWNTFSDKFSKRKRKEKKEVVPLPKYKRGERVYFIDNPCVVKWPTKYLSDEKVWQYYISGENFVEVVREDRLRK